MLIEDLSHLSGQSWPLTTQAIVGDIGSAVVMLLSVIVARCTLRPSGMSYSLRGGNWDCGVAVESAGCKKDCESALRSRMV